jgi:hypothetical protein
MGNSAKQPPSQVAFCSRQGQRKSSSGESAGPPRPIVQIDVGASVQTELTARFLGRLLELISTAVQSPDKGTLISSVSTGRACTQIGNGLGPKMTEDSYRRFGTAPGRQENAGQSEASGQAGTYPRCGRTSRFGQGDVRPSWLPDPRQEPTVPVWPVVGRVLGRKRSAILELARRDQLPVRVLRVGRSYRVATAELLQVLGFDNLEADAQGTRSDQAN